MIVEKILGQLDGGTEKTVDKVYVDWFEHNKHLLKKTSESGTEIGIRVEEPLHDGDILYEDDSRVIVVEMNPAELIRINVSEITEMGRLCFEIGNRHLSIAIRSDSVRIPYDEPTYRYLKELGFDAELVREKFTGYREVRAHAHSHGHHHDE